MSFSKETDVRLDRDGIDAPQPADQGCSNVHAFRKERPALAPSPPIHGVLPTLIFKAGEWLAGHSKFWNLVLGAAMVAAIGLLDLITGPDLSLSIFYLLPIALITWSAGRTAGIVLSLSSAGLWLAADVGGGHVYSSPAMPYWNAAVRLGIFLIVAHMVSALSVSLEWARTDYLTGLANARGFHDLAMQQLHWSRRAGHSCSLAYLDIDDFKLLNDRLGHNTADFLLRLVGHAFRQATRKSDIVARVGGDEFAILLPAAGYDSAAAALVKIRENLRVALARDGWSVTFSAGLATFQKTPESVEEATTHADSLMYAAKRAGKNTTVHRLIETSPSGSAISDPASALAKRIR